MITPPDQKMDLTEIAPGTLSYQDAKRFARHPDQAVRCALAERPDVPPEVLYFLADDPDPTVRRTIVQNQATPPLAHLVLVDDRDVDVRSDLAERIVQLAPGLTADERDRARQTAYRVLERLVRDQLPRIRKILAEALKDVTNAPPEIINQLARDVEITVATPILEYSPVLRDEDLLDIIGSHPPDAALAAISRRSTVGPQVSDAIAASEDATAIAHLLANPSAQIREETLDRLVDQAVHQPTWHAPLVRRPGLRRETAVRLAHFVADRYIQTLLSRQDLSADALDEVRRVVHQRLNTTPSDPASDTLSAHPLPLSDDAVFHAPPVVNLDTRNWSSTLVSAYVRCAALGEQGLLNEAGIKDAIGRSDRDFVICALAIRSGLNVGLVHGVLRAASGRGIAALTWKAGLTPAISTTIQTRLAKLPPREVIPAQNDLPFGLSVTEMEWQLEMFAQIAAAP